MRKMKSAKLVLTLLLISSNSFAATKVLLSVVINNIENSTLDSGIRVNHIRDVATRSLESKGFEVVSTKSAASDGLELIFNVAIGGSQDNIRTSGAYSVTSMIFADGKSPVSESKNLAIRVQTNTGYCTGPKKYVLDYINKNIDNNLKDFVKTQF